MKYIIDLPDNCSWVQWIMTSDKDGHAYFDFKQPRDLTPLDDELEKAYQKGLHAGESKCEYCDEYKRGLDDAWNAAREIVTCSGANKPLDEMFGMHGVFDIINKFSASEAIVKLKAYEESQKVDADIKVGDVVKNTLDFMDNAVGYFIEPANNKYYRVLRHVDGKIDIVTWHRENCVRTGGHSYAVERMYAVLKDTQSCSSCEYSDDPDGVRCGVCCGYDKWELKEGAE